MLKWNQGLEFQFANGHAKVPLYSKCVELALGKDTQPYDTKCNYTLECVT